MPSIDAAAALHASRHAAGGADPITPAGIGAADKWATTLTGDANTFFTQGVYLVAASVANTPTSLSGGHIEVLTRQAAPRYATQRFTANGGTLAGITWTRHSTDGATWGGWTLLGGGDTAWRQTTTFLSAGFATDRARIRRVRQTVSVNLQGTTVADSHSYVESGMPLGFRPSSAGVIYPVFEYLPAAGPRTLGHFGLNSSGTTFFRTSVAGALYFECSYLTDDAWPTTLPGTPA